MLHKAIQGLGQALVQGVAAASPLTWLGKGARPFTAVQAAPGKYYVPSKHPYQATLPGGIKVQEAYPGQYYEPHPQGSGTVPPGIMPRGMGALGPWPLAYPRWMCALIGAALVGGAGYGGTRYWAKKRVPALSTKKKKNMPLQVGFGSAVAGAIAGYFMCGPSAPAPTLPPGPGPSRMPPPPPPPPQDEPPLIK